MQEDLDIELTEALEKIDEAEAVVVKKREGLANARIALAKCRERVAEIQGEIRARVRSGQSTRPLLDGISSHHTSPSAEDGAPRASSRARKPQEAPST